MSYYRNDDNDKKENNDIRDLNIPHHRVTSSKNKNRIVTINNYNQTNDNDEHNIDINDIVSEEENDNIFMKQIKHMFQKFRFASFTFIIVVFLIIIFIASLVIYKYNLRKISKIIEFSDDQKKSLSWSCSLYFIGSNYTPAIILNKQIHRLLSAIFLHGSYLHLGGNILSMLFTSFFVEDFIGLMRFMIFFFLSGIYGNLLAGIFEKDTQSLGASGVIFGIYGILIQISIFHWKSFSEKTKNLFFYFILIFVINFISSFSNYKETHTAIFAHIGGFLIGLMIGYCYIDLDENHNFFTDNTLNKLKIAQKVCFIMTILTYVATIIIYITLDIDQHSNKLGNSCNKLIN